LESFTPPVVVVGVGVVAVAAIVVVVVDDAVDAGVTTAIDVDRVAVNNRPSGRVCCCQ
jgi:predicted LPLAT superfamily acyltransferase